MKYIFVTHFNPFTVYYFNFTYLKGAVKPYAKQQQVVER